MSMRRTVMFLGAAALVASLGPFVLRTIPIWPPPAAFRTGFRVSVRTPPS